ncbi:hypothetical protein ACFS27_12335 [Promicromonospora vindobonensis]|uniref:Uncharacterized protein n=1 Tax=Promicromonospora vindobonensis TaxID=195748 RepID=A0ABW5VTT9_9MICO
MNLRGVAIAGLVMATVGIYVARAGGAPAPVVPPAVVLMLVAAVLLAVFRTRTWPAVVAVVVALAEAAGVIVTGSLGNLGFAEPLLGAGTALRVAGGLAVLVAGIVLVVRRPARSGASGRAKEVSP